MQYPLIFYTGILQSHFWEQGMFATVLFTITKNLKHLNVHQLDKQLNDFLYPNSEYDAATEQEYMNQKRMMPTMSCTV